MAETSDTAELRLTRPRGTRDFYPQEMGWRNFLLDAWRRVSIRHGFDQVDAGAMERYVYVGAQGDAEVLVVDAQRGELIDAGQVETPNRRPLGAPIRRGGLGRP